MKALLSTGGFLLALLASTAFANYILWADQESTGQFFEDTQLCETQLHIVQRGPVFDGWSKPVFFVSGATNSRKMTFPDFSLFCVHYFYSFLMSVDRTMNIKWIRNFDEIRYEKVAALVVPTETEPNGSDEYLAKDRLVVFLKARATSYKSQILFLNPVDGELILRAELPWVNSFPATPTAIESVWYPTLKINKVYWTTNLFNGEYLNYKLIELKVDFNPDNLGASYKTVQPYPASTATHSGYQHVAVQQDRIVIGGDIKYSDRVVAAMFVFTHDLTTMKGFGVPLYQNAAIVGRIDSMVSTNYRTHPYVFGIVSPRGASNQRIDGSYFYLIRAHIPGGEDASTIKTWRVSTSVNFIPILLSWSCDSGNVNLALEIIGKTSSLAGTAFLEVDSPSSYYHLALAEFFQVDPVIGSFKGMQSNTFVYEYCATYSCSFSPTMFARGNNYGKAFMIGVDSKYDRASQAEGTNSTAHLQLFQWLPGGQTGDYEDKYVSTGDITLTTAAFRAADISVYDETLIPLAQTGTTSDSDMFFDRAIAGHPNFNALAAGGTFKVEPTDQANIYEIAIPVNTSAKATVGIGILTYRVDKDDENNTGFWYQKMLTADDKQTRGLDSQTEYTLYHVGLTDPWKKTNMKVRTFYQSLSKGTSLVSSSITSTITEYPFRFMAYENCDEATQHYSELRFNRDYVGYSYNGNSFGRYILPVPRVAYTKFRVTDALFWANSTVPACVLKAVGMYKNWGEKIEAPDIYSISGEYEDDIYLTLDYNGGYEGNAHIVYFIFTFGFRNGTSTSPTSYVSYQMKIAEKDCSTSNVRGSYFFVNRNQEDAVDGPLFNFTNELLPESVSNNLCWPSYELTPDLAENANVFAVTEEDGLKYVAYDSAFAGEAWATLRVQFPFEGSQFNIRLSLNSCKTGIVLDPQDMVKEGSPVVQFGTGKQSLARSQYSGRLTNFRDCPPIQYGVFAKDAIWSSSGSITVPDFLLEINQKVGTIFVNTEAASLKAKAGDRFIEFNLALTTLNSPELSMKFFVQFGCDFNTIKAEWKGGASFVYPGVATTVDLSSYINVTSDFQSCWEKDMKIYSEGSELLPSTNYDCLQWSKTRMNSLFTYSITLELDASCTRKRELDIQYELYGTGGIVSMSEPFVIKFCGDSEVTYDGGPLFEQEIIWQEGTVFNFATSFGGMAGAATITTDEPVCTSGNDIVVDAVNLYPFDQTKDKSNQTITFVEDGITQVEILSSSQQIIIYRSRVTGISSTKSFEFSLAFKDSLYEILSFRKFRYTLCKKAAASVKPLSFDYQFGVASVTVSVFGDFITIEDHCTFPSFQGIHSAIVVDGEGAGQINPRFDSAKNLLINTLALKGTASTYSVKIALDSALPPPVFPLIVRVCGSLSLQAEAAFVSMSIPRDDSRVWVNLTQQYHPRSHIQDSSFSFCLFKTIKVSTDKGGTAPLPSSFLGRAVRVNNYGLEVLVPEVKESKDYSFFIKATDQYDEASFQPINLKINKEVNHLPYFDGKLTTEFALVFDGDGKPDQDEIAYYSPEVKDDDGDAFEAEFEFDSSLKSFLTMSFSGNQVHLMVNPIGVNQEKQVGEHMIKISLIDKSQPNVLNSFQIKLTITKLEKEEALAEEDSSTTEPSNTPDTPETPTTTPEVIISPTNPEASEQQINPADLSEEQVTEILDEVEGYSELDSETKAIVAKTVPGLFPGISVSELFATLRRMIAHKEKLNSQSGDEEAEESKMSASISSFENNQINLQFTKPLIVPSDTSSIDYSTVFHFTVKSALDGSVFDPKLQSMPETAKKPSRRQLSSTEEAGESSSLAFDWSVIEHTSQRVAIEFKFDFPEKLSTTRYGRDEITMEIVNLGPFISAETGEALTIDDFGLQATYKAPKFQVPIPPMISAEVKQLIGDSTKGIGTMVNSVSFGNFALALLTSGSMQQLWGLIRAVQLIILTALMEITFPSNAAEFYKRAILFSTMDMLSGEELYGILFSFKSTLPLSAKFEEMDFKDLNFVMNSGSFFIILLLICLEPLGRFILTRICLLFSKYKAWRQLGIMIHTDSKVELVRVGSLRLFMESYFEICMCSFLSLVAFLASKNWNELLSFVQKRDDIMSTSLAVFGLVAIVAFPIWALIRIRQVFQDKQRRFSPHLGILFEEFDMNSRPKAMYQVFFLTRRLILVALLVFLRHQVFFQCMLISHLSLLNFIYLSYYQPFKSETTNRLEAFNEFTVMTSSAVINSFLNAGSDLTFREFSGWLLVGVACTNIGVNLIILGLSTFIELARSYREKKKEKEHGAALRKRFLSWKTFHRAYPTVPEGDFNHIKGEYLVRNFCREWAQHRNWLKHHRVDLSLFKEEEQFQRSLEKFHFKEKAQSLKVVRHHVEFVGSIQERKVDRKIKTQAQLQSLKMLAVPKRSRNKILSKLTAIEEEEEAGWERDLAEHKKTLVEFKPVVSKFEANLLRAKARKLETGQTLTEVEVQDIGEGLDLDFALDPTEEQDLIKHEVETKLINETSRHLPQPTSIVTFRPGALGSLLQLLFKIPKFREAVLQSKPSSSSQNKLQFQSELKECFKKADLALQAAEPRGEVPSITIENLSNFFKMATEGGETTHPTQTLHSILKLLDSETRKVAKKIFAFSLETEFECSKQDCQVRSSEKRSVLKMVDQPASIPDGLDLILRTDKVFCEKCKSLGKLTTKLQLDEGGVLVVLPPPKLTCKEFTLNPTLETCGLQLTLVGAIIKGGRGSTFDKPAPDTCSVLIFTEESWWLLSPESTKAEALSAEEAAQLGAKAQTIIYSR